jgi:WD40 repeat protein
MAEKFDVFISYNRGDVVFAEHLESTIENYKIPALGDNKPRHLKVFRDESDMTGTDYHAAIEQHLKTSSKLVVICSPLAAKSLYVNDEVERFIRLRGAENLVPVLLDGIPNNETKPGDESQAAFPPAMCEAIDMPLALDFKNFDKSKHKVKKPPYENAWYGLLANLVGCSRSEIEQRERQRKLRLIRIYVAISSVISLVLLASTIIAFTQRSQAIKASAASDFNYSVALFEQDQVPEAMSLLASAVRKAPEAVHARSVMLEALANRRWQVPIAVLQNDSIINSLAVSPDDRNIAVGYEDGSIYLWPWQEDLKQMEPFTRHLERVTVVSFSPDGKYLVTASDDGSVRLFNQNAPSVPYKELQRSELGTTQISFDVASERMIIASKDGSARVWNVETGELIIEVKHTKNWVMDARFSPDGNHLVTAGRDGEVRIWNSRTGAPIGTSEHSKVVLWADFSADSKHVYSTSFDWFLQRTGLNGENAIRKRQPMLPMNALFNERHTHLLTMSSDAQVYDLNLNKVGPSTHHSSNITSGAFGPDDLVVTGAQDSTAKILDWKQSKRYEAMIHRSPPKDIAFSHSGNFIVSGSWFGKATVWQLAKLDEDRLKPLKISGKGKALTLNFSPDGKQLAIAGEYGLRIVDPKTGLPNEFLKESSDPQERCPTNVNRGRIPNGWPGQPQMGAYFDPMGGYLLNNDLNNFAVLQRREATSGKNLIFCHEAIVRVARPSANGKSVVTASDDGIARIWDASSGKQLLQVGVAATKMIDALLSPNDKWLATATTDNVVRIWDAVSGEPLLSKHTGAPLTIKHSTNIVRITFSPDSNWLASASNDRTAKLQSLTRDQASIVLPHPTGVRNLVFRPDSKALLTVSFRSAQSWSLPLGEMIGTELLHPEPLAIGKNWGNGIFEAAYSKDGQRIITAARDGEVRLWVAETGFLISDKMKHSAEVWAAAFSPDGQTVATATRNGMVSIWPVPTGTPEDSEMLASVAEAVAGLRFDQFSQSPDMNERVNTLKELVRTTSCKNTYPHSAGCIVQRVLKPED